MKKPACPAALGEVSTPPPASSAFTWLAARTTPPSTDRYRGLIPIGSRASSIPPRAPSHSARANIPRSACTISAPRWR
jgi:hypothetical protein